MRDREYAISILTAAGLVGLKTFFLKPTGLTQAARAAQSLGFGIQLLPLNMIPFVSETMSSFLSKAMTEHFIVVAYEDRWGGVDWLHPLRFWRDWAGIIAYYLLFPIRYSKADRIKKLIGVLFPTALAIDCNKSTAQEVSPNTNPDPTYWTELSRKGVPVVIDTYHLHQDWKTGDGYGLICNLIQEQISIAALQIQFRELKNLEDFLARKGDAYNTLVLLKEQLTDDTPVILELTPSITTYNHLLSIREVAHEVLS